MHKWGTQTPTYNYFSLLKLQPCSPFWTSTPPPSVPWYRSQNHVPRRNQGPPVQNLTFLELNMVTKKPHWKRSRYACLGCWLTLAEIAYLKRFTWQMVWIRQYVWQMHDFIWSIWRLANLHPSHVANVSVFTRKTRCHWRALKAPNLRSGLGELVPTLGTQCFSLRNFPLEPQWWPSIEWCTEKIKVTIVLRKI